ncbi:LytR/AlgR family response regulator transcription factor [Niabella drilacis]|uniref:Two component transcriptional regulator, LytTR family n=1 Tax=Niabella drilacis (strain DSM 25811 / CCM 8410 / CCUG 62505 / LMG 26954 / E90) TaxID=1285928 RepID=A0A1G6V5L6_NIADE|nr:LytTR family DNA-binding domain-containing protein [Niabella drilacis]SDD48882.1 two component transcriptional regulator, LytTR family [Niabella drilacis]
MNNLTCFIVDDEQGAIDTLSVFIKRYLPFLEIKGTATAVQQAQAFLCADPVDLLFLDIRMRQETGFDLLRQLPGHKAHIIFVTAYDEYGIQAIKFSATDYLLKPVRPEELIAAVHKVSQRKETEKDQVAMLLQSYDLQRSHTQKRIALPGQAETRYVLIENIVCCRADNSYTSFYILNENRPVVVSRSISEYEGLLFLYGFVRIHQSWLVNKNRISSFKKEDGGYLFMDNKMQVPVSRQRRHLLKEL